VIIYAVYVNYLMKNKQLTIKKSPPKLIILNTDLDGGK
jgi:hypothetical protein